MVADVGFTSRENILAMVAPALDFIGSLDGSNPSAGQCKNRGVDHAFWPEHFSYDEKNNMYTCPRGKTLRPQGKEAKIRKTNYMTPIPGNHPSEEVGKKSNHHASSPRAPCPSVFQSV